MPNYFPNYTKIYDDYICHHGIEGQKWGVRNGPPYPLDRVKGTLTKQQTSREVKRAKNNNKSDYSLAARWVIRTGTDIGFSLMNPANLGYVALDVYEGFRAVGAVAKKKRFDNEKVNDKIDPKTSLRLKHRTMTADEDLERVNPLVYNFDNATKNNCMLCTTAYDLRRRGYDVEANVARYGYIPSYINEWYPDAKLISITGHNEKGKSSNKDAIDNLKKTVILQGNGARGNLIVRWKAGGAHSMIYEVRNGQMFILDGQINKKYPEPEKILKRCAPVYTFARLDNIDFDPNKIKELIR